MKKLALILLSCCFAATIHAQEDVEEPEEVGPEAPTRNFRIGVRLGAAYSTLSSGNLVNPRFIFGIAGGMTARFKIGHIRDDNPEDYRYGIETQLNFTYKGSNFKNAVLEYKRLSLFYVDLPVYGILKLDKKGSVKAMAGIYGAYLMNTSFYMESKNYQDSTSLALKKYDVGVGVGLEYKTRIMGFQFMLKQGLTDINDGLNQVNYPHIRPSFDGSRIRNFSMEFIFSF